MKKVFYLVMLLLSCTILFAQAPSIEWQKCLGGNGADLSYSVVTTNDGGCVAVGRSASSDGNVGGTTNCADETNIWIVKLDSKGTIQWQKCLGGNDIDLAMCVQNTDDGGYIIAGSSNSSDGDVSGNHGDYDVWIVKLNADGMIQWKKCFGGSGNDGAQSIRQTSDGGYIAAGYTRSNDGDVIGNHGTAGTSDCWIVKLSSTGNLEWQKCLGGSYHESFNDIQLTSDGGYIAAGYTISIDGDVSGLHGSANFCDYWIVKISSTGDPEWQKCLGGSNYDVATSVLQTSGGDYIVAGHINSNDGDVSGLHGSTNYGDCWIVKLSSTGDLKWQKCLGGSNAEEATSIIQTSDGNYIVAGCTLSNDSDVSGNHGKTDAWIVKLKTTGDLEWQKCLGGSGEEESQSVRQTSDGSYIIAGWTFSNDDDVSGHHGTASNGDYWIVKLSKETGVDDFDAVNSFNNNINIYPNPSSNIITIKTPDSALESNISIYDVFGRQIYFGKINGNEITVDVSDFAPGTYSAMFGDDRKIFVVSR